MRNDVDESIIDALKPAPRSAALRMLTFVVTPVFEIVSVFAVFAVLAVLVFRIRKMILMKS